MAAWIVITAEDLNDYLVAAQVAALQSAALATGQADPFDKVMADITQRMRRKIESCSRNTLSATANSIPPELKWAACYLIIEALQGRLNLKLNDLQKEQIDTAKADLNRIAECKDVVSTPDDPLVPSTAQRSGSISLVSSTNRTTRRKDQDGL